MTMAGSILFGFALVVLAAILVWRHKSVWDEAQRFSSSAHEKDFARRQYRRRTQTSTMIGLVGAAIGAQPWITPWFTDASAAIAYVVGLIAAVGWILLLGVADMASTYAHLQRIRRVQIAEQAAMQARLRLEVENRKAERENSPDQDEP